MINVEPGILPLRPGPWTADECRDWLVTAIEGWTSILYEGFGLSDARDRAAYRNLCCELSFATGEFARGIRSGDGVEVRNRSNTERTEEEALEFLSRIVATRPGGDRCDHFADQEPYEQLAKELARRLATVKEPEHEEGDDGAGPGLMDEAVPLLPLEESADVPTEDSGEQATAEPLELHLLPLPEGLVDGEMTPERAQTWLCNELADWLGACRHPLMDHAYSDRERDSFCLLNFDADRLASRCARSVRDGMPFALTQIEPGDSDYPSTVTNLMDLVKHQRLSHSTDLSWQWCFDDLGEELQRRLEHVQITNR